MLFLSKSSRSGYNLSTVNATSKSSKNAPDSDYLGQAAAHDPTSNALKIVLLALALVIAAIGAYVYFGEKPPVATGEVIRVTAVPIHQESNLPAAAGMPGQQDSFDQVLVMAQIRVHNQSKGQLFLHEMESVLTLPDDLERRSLAVNKSDFARAYVAYPQLAPLKGEPIVRDITMEPGQTIEGLMLFPYPLTREQYDKKKSLDINVVFLHQKTLTLRVPQ